MVDAGGSSASVQGQLVYANAALTRCCLDGIANYVTRETPDQAFADTELGEISTFLVGTMIANLGQALDPKDVAYFESVCADVASEWWCEIRLFELDEKADDVGLSSAEEDAHAQLENARLDWNDLCDRTERCVANWCLKNDTLVDRQGSPIVVGGFASVRAIFAGPQPRLHCGQDHVGRLCD